MTILAQVSIYPLRQRELSPAIEAAWRVFEERGIDLKKGTMSTVLSGEPTEVFAALQEAFERVAESGGVSMVVTISNACPEEV